MNRIRSKILLHSNRDFLLIKSLIVACIILVNDATQIHSLNPRLLVDNDGSDNNDIDQAHPRTSFRRIAVNISAISAACIGDDAGLRRAVLTASTDPSKSATIITLCDRVKITNKRNPSKQNSTGIDLSKKQIDLKCVKTNGGRCVLDGQRSSRIFSGSATNLRATNFDFINAFPPGDDLLRYGTSLSFDSKSTITLNQCSFRNNRGSAWGTLSVANSTLTLRGTATSPMVFSNNYASSGGALYVENTKFNAVTGNIIFKNNTAAFNGAIRMSGSETALNGVSFVGNSAEDVGAILATDCKAFSLENVQFSNNRAFEYNSVMHLSNCATIFNRVTFTNNLGWWRGGLEVSMSNVSLTNCTFRNNTVWAGGGADIYISDDSELDPNQGGSFIACDRTIFCNGVGKRSILDSLPYKNTNCIEKGITRVCPV